MCMNDCHQSQFSIAPSVHGSFFQLRFWLLRTALRVERRLRSLLRERSRVQSDARRATAVPVPARTGGRALRTCRGASMRRNRLCQRRRMRRPMEWTGAMSLSDGMDWSGVRAAQLQTLLSQRRRLSDTRQNPFLQVRALHWTLSDV